MKNVPLSEVANIVYGKGLSTKELLSSGFPVFGANGLIGFYDRFLYDTEKLLISCRGAYSGKPNISPPKCFVTSNSLVLNLQNESEITRLYYYFYFQTLNPSDFVTGTAQPQVTIENLKEVLVPNPSDSVKESVVKKIKSLFAEIDNGVKDLENIKLKLELYRQSVLNAAIQGKLVPQDPKDEPASKLLVKIRFEKEELIASGKLKKEKPLLPIDPDETPFELPSGWEWARFGTLVHRLGDGIHGTPSYDESGDYFFINGNNLIEGVIEIKPSTKKISKAEFEKHKRPLSENTLLISINGTIGNIAFYNNEKIILGKSACYCNLSTLISKEYIKIVFNSLYFLHHVNEASSGSTIKNVSLQTMREFLIPLPPATEVVKIKNAVVSILDSIKSMQNVIEHKLIQTKNLKQSILKKAFDGELV